MTDDLTPQDDAVRRLLAEARHRGTTPPEVVARLDDALAGLVAERGSSALPGPADTPDTPDTAAPAPVLDLAARRRRRAGAGLLAAAAVVVAGVAIGQGLPITSGGSDSSASDSAGAGEAFQDQDSGGSAAQDPSLDAQLASPQAKSEQAAPEAALPSLSTADVALADELLALRPSAVSRARGMRTFDARTSCSPPDAGPGRRAQAEVDGRPGVVVYQPPSSGDQTVAVYVCGTAEPVRSITLPAP